MDTEALGKFGYSVAKNLIVKEKNKKENTKKEIISNSKKVKEKSNTGKEDKALKKSFKNKKNNKNKGKKNFSEKKSTKAINKKIRKTK